MQVSSQRQRNHHSKLPTTTGTQCSWVYLYYFLCKDLFKQPQEAFQFGKKKATPPQNTINLTF